MGRGGGLLPLSVPVSLFPLLGGVFVVEEEGVIGVAFGASVSVLAGLELASFPFPVESKTVESSLFGIAGGVAP